MFWGEESMKKFLAIFFVFFVFCIKNVNAQEIRIVHFSDVHIDTKSPDKKVRKFAKSLPMFEKAIDKANLLYPNIVVFSGDMVNKPIDSEFDIFLNAAKKLKAPFYPALGNHDVGVAGGLSKETIIAKLNANCPWLKLDKPYYSVIKGDYIFIFMDGTNDKIVTAKGFFSENELKFLDKTLSDNPDKKAIIVHHFPPMPPYKSISHEISNKEDYFAVIDKNPNVVMVLSGHFHATKAVQRNDVLYITTPSMIEYPHAFRYLKINDNLGEITIESRLFVNEEQNAMEDIDNPSAKIKIGEEGDNFFKIKLNKSFEQTKSDKNWRNTIIAKLKEIFNKIKLICCNVFLHC